MADRSFSQPNVVHSLCMALAKLANEPEISASLLAKSVEPLHPGVPEPVLRMIAAKVLRLYFDFLTVDDIKRDLRDTDDQMAACEFLGQWAAAESAD